MYAIVGSISGSGLNRNVDFLKVSQTSLGSRIYIATINIEMRCCFFFCTTVLIAVVFQPNLNKQFLILSRKASF